MQHNNNTHCPYYTQTNAAARMTAIYQVIIACAHYYCDLYAEATVSSIKSSDPCSYAIEYSFVYAHEIVVYVVAVLTSVKSWYTSTLYKTVLCSQFNDFTPIFNLYFISKLN